MSIITKKKIFTYLLSIFLLLLLSGCVEYIKEPDFLNEELQKKHSIRQYNKQESDALAADAWRFLHDYMNKKYTYDLIHAQNFFNYSWGWNHDNYNVYWGWGIIRGIHATMTKDQHLTEKYLLQCVDFLSMVPNYGCPVAELGNLNLDLANAYNLLGGFYMQTAEKDKALLALDKAKKILDALHNENPKNGRTLYLLAVNQFWLGDFNNSMTYVADAQKLNYPIPDDFIKGLKDASPPEK